MERQKGTAVTFNPEKGYGFIARAGASDVFVHHTQIQMDGFRVLEVGELVEFDIKQTGKGYQAINVTRVGA